MKPLPDTSTWKPKTDRQIALSRTFLQTCRSIEARIRAESDIEKDFSINNFDAGPGIEDIVREQFRMLLPARYTVTPGVVIDRNGNNCGECDLVVANRFWAPLLKYGATNESRRIHIPVEAVYSVLEIKKTLTVSELDDAMKKLVMYKGLERDRSEYGRLVENHVVEEFEKADGSLNRRFDAILAVSCEEGRAEELVSRFFKINERLEPHLRVNALAILGEGFAFYLFQGPDDDHMPHLYPESDMAYFYGWKPKSISPFYVESPHDTLFHLYSNLQQHLFLTVLNFRWMKLLYGFDEAYKTGYPINLD